MTSQAKVAKMISTNDVEPILNRLFNPILERGSISLVVGDILPASRWWTHEISGLQDYYFRHITPDLSGRQ